MYLLLIIRQCILKESKLGKYVYLIRNANERIN
jgi:hypothetical protein